jgi:hypothetical protein
VRHREEEAGLTKKKDRNGIVCSTGSYPPRAILEACRSAARSFSLTRLSRLRIRLFMQSTFVDIASKADYLDVDNLERLINGIDYANVASAQAVAALEFTTERLDVVLVKRIYR